MQRVLCVCVRDEKSLYIEPKDIKNIYFLIRKVLKYWTKWNKKSIFNLFLSLFWHLKIFQFSMYRMRYLAESRAFSHEFFTFIYIYIYIKYSHLERKKKSFITSVLSTSVKNPFLNKILKKKKKNLIYSKVECQLLVWLWRQQKEWWFPFYDQ